MHHRGPRRFAYDAQGREVYKKDQAGNVIERTFDGNGRQTARKVTNVASGFDNAVLRIQSSYDSLGRVSEIVQYDAASAGNATDGVKYTYDDWGNVASYAEDRDSAVIGSGNEYTTSYGWEKATTGRNTLRKTGITLPSTRLVYFTYSSTGSLHDADASRVTSLGSAFVELARYWYNGVGQVVGQDYGQPDVMWDLYGSSGTYPDLDDFNRVVSSRWTKDLSTDVDFYDVDLAYDRNSNITSATDNVHSGFDVLYTMDDVNRLTQAEEGTLSGGSITSRTRDQQWTLNQTGNWSRDKVDLNGDGDFTDTDELDDTRTHNDVNELTARDIDTDSSNDYTLTYDAAGNMTDDGESYEYEYDVFYRLRKVKKTTDQALVAEYRYNGLGHRIGVHEDTDTDGDVDGSDLWYYDAFDERWRHLARFRSSDSSPKEDFVPHQAGLDGSGGSSYIDLVVCRNKDANTAWTSASDGTLEERLYYCQNWRADVSAIVSSSGTMKEWDKYSAYGIPFGLPGGDTESDGDCDTTDVTQVQTWIDAPQYDLRGDIDLDGDVDTGDKSAIQTGFVGISLGRTSLSADTLRNSAGWAGHSHNNTDASSIHVRRRDLLAKVGRWNQRDPLKYLDSHNLYSSSRSNPLSRRDPTGLISASAGNASIAAETQCQGFMTYHGGGTSPCWVIAIQPQMNTTPGQCNSDPTCQADGTVRLEIARNPDPPAQCEAVWRSDPRGCHAWHGDSNCQAPVDWGDHDHTTSSFTIELHMGSSCTENSPTSVIHQATSADGSETISMEIKLVCQQCPRARKFGPGIPTGSASPGPVEIPGDEADDDDDDEDDDPGTVPTGGTARTTGPATGSNDFFDRPGY